MTREQNLVNRIIRALNYINDSEIHTITAQTILEILTYNDDLKIYDIKWDYTVYKPDNSYICILCGKLFESGIDGNELGFCLECQHKKDFPYDLDAYYRDYDNGKVAFKGIETMARGLLEPYRRK